MCHLVNALVPAKDTPSSLAVTSAVTAVLVYLLTLPCYFLVADCNFAKQKIQFYQQVNKEQPVAQQRLFSKKLLKYLSSFNRIRCCLRVVLLFASLVSLLAVHLALSWNLPLFWPLLGYSLAIDLLLVRLLGTLAISIYFQTKIFPRFSSLSDWDTSIRACREWDRFLAKQKLDFPENINRRIDMNILKGSIKMISEQEESEASEGVQEKKLLSPR